MSTGDQFCTFQAYKASPDYEEVTFLSNGGVLNDLPLDIVSPPKSQQNEGKSYDFFPSASLEILRNNYTSKMSKPGGKSLHCLGAQNSPSPSPLSTNDIIELAAINFIKSNTNTRDELSALSHPYASAFVGITSEHVANLQLLQDLLSSAEKVSNQQYVAAGKLLSLCHNFNFSQSNVIRRLVYYFSEALLDKIARETGRFNEEIKTREMNPMASASGLAAFHQKVPPVQVAQFAGVQELIGHVSSSKKVHIIDLDMRCGLHHVILMQALASKNESPLKHYKITAVVLSSGLMLAEDAGVNLRTLANSLNLSFSFHLIKLDDMLNLQKRRDSDEKTVVYASNALKFMIVRPNQLESLMRLIKNVNPCVMIVCEPEGNVNSPVFVNRFVEALFYYGAYFDCVEDCLKNVAVEREFVESNLFGPSLRTTVGAEGEERRSRIVGIDVWRAFFTKLGMMEKELSSLALDHARLSLKMFDCGDSCTLELNGKSLIVHWKGTALCSLSAWRFHKYRV
ncbi:hypothetical protein SASPL_105259 [Salvia splendens]|uniref:DELLA protein n=2 Tax=Salvia splendens TaxID=180675 RepID=A0A8X8YLD5_SALSN|nr:hypothetical protein SASPL_105259 [Salvia splendens]